MGVDQKRTSMKVHNETFAKFKALARYYEMNTQDTMRWLVSLGEDFIKEGK